MPQKGKDKLFHILNAIMNEEVLLTGWKKAVIAPIVKKEDNRTVITTEENTIGCEDDAVEIQNKYTIHKVDLEAKEAHNTITEKKQSSWI